MSVTFLINQLIIWSIRYNKIVKNAFHSFLKTELTYLDSFFYSTNTQNLKIYCYY